MKICINFQGRYQAFEFNPANVDHHTRVHESGRAEHFVLVQDQDRLGIVFCNSRKAANSLSGKIRYDCLPDLYVGSHCLGLGVLTHPRGWPDRQVASAFYAPLITGSLTAGGSHIPESTAEIFPPLPARTFAVLEEIPSASYLRVPYDDVHRRWRQGNRVTLFLRGSLPGRVDRMVFFLKNAETAQQLERDLGATQVHFLRLNEAVKAIVKEMHPTPAGAKWVSST